MKHRYNKPMRESLSRIKHLVESRVGVRIDTPNRQRELVYARAVYCLLASKYSINSLQDIGSVIQRDHATVLHALKMKDQIEMYSPYHWELYKTLANKIDEGFKYKEKTFDPAAYYKRKYTENLIVKRLLYHFIKTIISWISVRHKKSFTDKLRKELDNIINYVHDDKRKS
jgi:hypothetical protein